MSYISITDDDIREMLGVSGVSSIDELFADIPENIRSNARCDLPGPLSEIDLDRHMRSVQSGNWLIPSFLGGGVYHHYIPPVVDHLSSRSEFYTAYTPYQPEVSQGTLRAIFEFQTIMCRLTGMDIANASMYDGATSMAEAIFMSVRDNGKRKAVISKTVHPNYREVARTYAWAGGIELVEADYSGGVTDIASLEGALQADVSCVVVQSPNFFGCIEDLKAVKDTIASKKINLIVVVNEPLSLALLKSPGSFGADIVCGEAQSFGNPVAFGGPLLGFLAAREPFMRKMPGRLVGKSADLDGKEAYVLTLQTREQHIRRERATSNICSNEGLCLLRAVLYLVYYGNKLRELAQLNHARARLLRNRLLEKGFSCAFNRPFFNEFVVTVPQAEAAYEAMKNNGFNSGLKLGRFYPEMEGALLFAVTEMNTVEEIDSFFNILESISY
mgnify:CR=1 FL=1